MLGSGCGGDDTASALRKQLLRPRAPLAPELLKEWSCDGLLWESRTIQSELGEVGLVPFILAKLPGEEKLPVIFVLHGTSRSKDDPKYKGRVEKYARDGYLAVGFDARYHGDRRGGTEGLEAYYDALISRSWSTGEESPFMFDTAFDFTCLLDYMTERPDVMATKIGAVGVSLGGMHVWMTAAMDQRLYCPVPAIGVQGYNYALENELWGPRVDTLKPCFEKAAEDLGKDKIDTDVVRAVWQKITPGLLEEFDAPKTLPLIAPRPLFIVNGELDDRCPKEGVMQAVELARPFWAENNAEENLQVYFDEGVKHAVTDTMWAKIDEFFAMHLK